MLFPTIGFTEVHKCTSSRCPHKPSGGTVPGAVDLPCLFALLCAWLGWYETEPCPPARDVIGPSCGTAHFSERTFFVLLPLQQSRLLPHVFFGRAKKTAIRMDPWSFSVFDIKKLGKRPSQWHSRVRSRFHSCHQYGSHATAIIQPPVCSRGTIFFFLNHLLEFCARIGCMDPLHLCRFIRIPFQGKFEDRRRRQPWLTAS